MKNQKAKELLNKAMELRGSKAAFLREVSVPMRAEIQKIKYDTNLSPAGSFAKIKELKEKESKNFMHELALRKQAYQQYLTESKQLAKVLIEKSVVYADEATKAKFTRDFAELKFRIALKDEKGGFSEVKLFVDNVPDAAYSSLLMENFFTIAERFKDNDSKLALHRTYDKLKSDYTPEEVTEAYEIIEDVDASINNKMFTIMMPGDNPSSNPEYSLIGELFSQDALRHYQDPEAYFAKIDEPMPVFVDPDKEVAEVKKPQADPEYAATMKSMNEMRAKLDAMQKGDE